MTAGPISVRGEFVRVPHAATNRVDEFGNAEAICVVCRRATVIQRRNDTAVVIHKARP